MTERCKKNRDRHASPSITKKETAHDHGKEDLQYFIERCIYAFLSFLFFVIPVTKKAFLKQTISAEKTGIQK
jgi:hypothetical protein